MLVDDVTTVLHLDDDILELERVRLELKDFQVLGFEGVDEFMAAAVKERPEILLVDVHLKKNLNGLALIDKLRHHCPDSLIVVISNDIGHAQEAMHRGADDFVVKRSKPQELSLRLSASLRLKGRNQAMEIDNNFVGKTINSIRNQVPRIVSSAVTSVLVTGESGTGKEVVAEIFQSVLGTSQLKKVNCAAISSSLMESELFGHCRGAFTGATKDRVGLIESANGGWLFLDEVAELDLKTQAALLRALENHEIVRVGENIVRKVDFRIVAATNEDLSKLVADSKFRLDLLQRLQETVIHLPPLRERPLEVIEFMDHFCRNERGGPYTMAPETKAILLGYDWSAGNVRELRNCIRAMTASAIDSILTPMGIPAWVLQGAKLSVDSETSANFRFPNPLPSWKALCDQLLVAAIESLSRRQGKLSLQSVADALGLPKSTLASKIKQLQVAGVLTKQEVQRLFLKKVE